MGALLGLWGRAGVSLEPMTVMYEKYLMASAVTDSLPCVVEAVPGPGLHPEGPTARGFSP